MADTGTLAVFRAEPGQCGLPDRRSSVSAGEKPLSWGELLSAQYRRSTLALVFAVALHATNFFVFATLAPSVAFDVGGLDLISWATTLFVVTSIISSASGGMIRAWLGIRRSLMLAATVFAAGSLMVALAWNMPGVLAGRTVQGLGAGLLMAYSHGMIRDLFPPATWARMFAVVSGGWGVAALSGPLLGGIFAEFDAWRSGFLLMVGAAGLFVVLVIRSLPPDGPDREPGSLGQVPRLALLGASALLLGSVGSTAAAGFELPLAGASLLCFAATVTLEIRSSDRLFPRDMFRPATVLGSGVLFVFGITFATVLTSVYGPLLFRMIHSIPVLATGFVVTTQSMAWTLAAIVFSGLARTGSRVASAAGPVITMGGVVLTGMFLPAGPLAGAVIGIAVTGFGIGLAWGHIGRILFEVVDETDRHRVGSVMPLTQSIGIMFGSSAAGVIANAAGFSDSLTTEAAGRVAEWLYLGVGPMCILAVIGGVRVAIGTGSVPERVSRPPR